MSDNIDTPAGFTPLTALAFGAKGAAPTPVTATQGLPVANAPATGTSRIAIAGASVNATVAKASPGTLRQASGYNASSSPRYLRFYDKATAPTVGTDALRKVVFLPPLSPFVLDMNDKFAAGIAYALTTGSADADAGALTAGDILSLNVDYL